MPCAPVTVFTGMSQTQLQAALSAAQTALIELQTGAMVVSLSYAQGDGNRSVTQKMTSVAEVTALIVQLQQALGIRRYGRRPLRFTFR